MINAIIVDDERDGAEVLQYIVRENCPNVNVLCLAHSVEKAIELINEYKPNLVFLDIEMPTGTGFDVIEATKHLEFETIFTTAYEHYAIRAFKTNAVDYLLKPIEINELIEAVKNVEQRLNGINKRSAEFLEAFLASAMGKSKKISIPTMEGFILVDENDIIRLEAESNYTHILIKDKPKLFVSKTLKSIEEQMSKVSFCRVHSAHLINLNEIEKYIKGDGGTLVMKNGDSIPVSRAHKNELLIKLGLS